LSYTVTVDCDLVTKSHVYNCLVDDKKTRLLAVCIECLSCCCDDSKSISHQVAGVAAGHQHQEVVGARIESRPTEATPRQSNSESVLGNTRQVSGLWCGLVV